MTSRVAENNVRVSTPECNTSAAACQVDSAKKRCPKCKEWKDRSEYYTNRKSGSKDGLDCWCKECRKKYISEWKHDNRERLKNYRPSQEKDTEYKARHRAKHRIRSYARQQLTQAREKGLTLNYCSWLGCTETSGIQGHHPDYSKPHEIVSVCNLHHKAVDLCGDKLGFNLPVIDISPWLKPSKRGRPQAERRLEVGGAQ